MGINGLEQKQARNCCLEWRLLWSCIFQGINGVNVTL